VGQTLIADISGLGGSGIVTYQWKRGSADIGTNSLTYQVQFEDVGYRFTVTVTRADNPNNVESAQTAAVPVPPLTGTVSISGTAKVGQTLTADTSGLGGSGTVTYQWKRGSANIGTNGTYIVQAADEESTITVTVTRSGYNGSVPSQPAAVTAYSVGDTGPGGGKVFSARDTYLNGWRYLEAAPVLPDTYAWASTGRLNTDIGGNNIAGFGREYNDTAAILARDANAPAAKACVDYRGGGLSDWYLPSYLELGLIHSIRAIIGGFSNTYWSSNQYDNANALKRTFSEATYSSAPKGDKYYVIPIRQF
jgi:hypothetical protein